MVLASSAAFADDDSGQALLDKATETKLSAENVADLNEVIKLCESASKRGLMTTTRSSPTSCLPARWRAAELVMELFERPVSPPQARKLVEMAVADLEQPWPSIPSKARRSIWSAGCASHLGSLDKALCLG